MFVSFVYKYYFEFDVCLISLDSAELFNEETFKGLGSLSANFVIF